MRIKDVALTYREEDEDIGMFIRTENEMVKGFTIPRELLSHLSNSIHKKLKRKK